MKKFLIIYHMSPEAFVEMGETTAEEKAEGMKPWFAWKESMGDKLLDFGSPLMGGTRLIPGGSTEISTKHVGGYSIIQAENMDDAKSSLQDHPHLAWSSFCTIEVHEFVPM